MKIICVGRNYTEHIEELNNSKPESPVLFLKPDTALVKGGEAFYYPDFSNQIDYECELVIKISKIGKSIPISCAKNYYEEVALGLDLTCRDLQAEEKSKSLPWTLSKAFDYSAPISEFFSLKELGKDVQNLDFSLLKNGNIVQNANTLQMIFSVDEIISYISRFISLKVGDLIFTGTPAGVGSVKIGDKLVGVLEGKEILKCEIK
ncbi:MAG: fumarylacetoacetate hydrolase family protein [Bacteroidales bacterium]|nr:fumarylacetoacetate hydrolase family protein [Bacteroidales bacterium]